MPDLDRFRRSFEAFWRRSYNLANSGNCDSEFEDATFTALTRTLLESEGCPAFSEIAATINNVEQENILHPLFMFGGGKNISEVFEKLRLIEKDQSGHISTKLAVKAAMTLLVKEMGNISMGGYSDPALRLAEQLCISQFLNLVLEKELKVNNPFQFWTKGKMCRSLNKPGLDTLAGMTISCDSFPLRIPVSHQCGTCTSCLLRRLSLFSAGLGIKDQASAYQHDVFSLKAFKSYDEKRKKLYPFLAMSDQANKIESCLNSPLPWLALMGVFPELREVQESIAKDTNQNQGKIAELILELYHEYIREWKGFYNYLDKREIFSCSSMC